MSFRFIVEQLLKKHQLSLLRKAYDIVIWEKLLDNIL